MLISLSREELLAAQARYGIYLYALPMGIICAVLGYIYGNALFITQYELLSYPPLAALLAVLLFCIVFTKIPIAYVERILLIGIAIHLDLSLFYHVSHIQTISSLISMEKILGHGFWSMAIYTMIFWLFELPVAKRIAWIHLGSLMLITTLLYVNTAGPQLIGQNVYYLSQLFAGQALFIMIFSAYTYMLEERQKTTHQMMHRAYTDELTTLANRRFLDLAIVNQFECANKHQQSFSVVLLDIDHFKNVNDTYGHFVGDKVLQQISQILLKEVDKHSFIGRWGGEEFLLVLPNSTLTQAEANAWRIKRALERAKFIDDLSITASFGVSEYRSCDTTESLLVRADSALYQAKSSGRNQVIGA